MALFQLPGGWSLWLNTVSEVISLAKLLSLNRANWTAKNRNLTRKNRNPAYLGRIRCRSHSRCSQSTTIGGLRPSLTPNFRWSSEIPSRPKACDSFYEFVESFVLVVITIREMAKRVNAAQPPDFPPDKTFKALKKQLAAIEELQGRNHRDSDNAVREWKNLTMTIFIHGFGENSENVSQLKNANLVGQSWHPGMTDQEIQKSFQSRIEAFAATIRSSLAELELLMPESEVAGSYDAGEEYQFYKDLNTIVGFATTELFVIDNYLDAQLFDIYMENLSSSVSVRVLTNNVGEKLRLVADKFARRRGFELRSSRDVHDRVVFSDDRCWVIGQSIKDAATKKPTYIVEHSGSSSMRAIYESIWSESNVVAKSLQS